MRLYTRSLVNVLGEFEVLRCVVWYKLSRSFGMGRSRGQLYVPTALYLGAEIPVPTEYESGWALYPFWALWSTGKCIVPAGNPKITDRACDKNYRLSPRYETV
jgi:hypothetical protein